jgi:2-dehydro-3-deoxyphosphooctonate aldolase (KDO 8-P synthase)
MLMPDSQHLTTIGTLSWSPATQLLIIAGPCVIESEQMCMDIGGKAKEICTRLGLPYVFKASFDKANRSSVASFRGEGMEAGLAILSKVKQSLGVPVTTDLHDAGQAAAVAAQVDLLQIPAFLCRQTDLLVAAGETGKPVNVKKGQFMAPWEMKQVVDKVRSTGNHNVLLTERGTFFGYNRLVNDMTGIPQMQSLGTPTIFDATHSTQLPGALGTSTGGQREYVPLLAHAAVAAGCDGLFIEAHPNPSKSPSDAATILALNDLEPLLERCKKIWHALR